MRIYHAAFLLIAACSVETGTPSDTSAVVTIDAGVECPPVQSSVSMHTGDVFFDGLRNISVDNGVVRVKYGSRSLDLRDSGYGLYGNPVAQNNDRHMDHFMEARHHDDPSVTDVAWNGQLQLASSTGCRAGRCHDGSGTHWHDTQYTWYGDGTAYSSSIVNRDADRMRVLRADDDSIELSYEWDNIRLDGLSSSSSCILGAYPECGPTDRDSLGDAIFKHNGGTVISVKTINLWKVIKIERCTPGYYVSLRSDPPLKFPEQGPRAVRLGYVTSVRSFSCDGLEATSHPRSPTSHFLFSPTDCIADIPSPQTPSSHEGWPFVRFMVTSVQRNFSSIQYSNGQLGSPGATDLPDVTGPDGRPMPWQAFIGAFEYVSTDPSVEPTSELLEEILERAALVGWR